MTDFVNSVGFKEAMEYAASRKVVLPDDYYGKLVGIQRAQSVSVAGLAALEQIRFVIDKLADVLEKGGTFKSFQDSVREGGLDINLPTHRLENIFRTNIQAAYSRGRWEQQTRARGTRPYLMYDAINDSRTRPAHAAMDSIIRRWDDPFWATNYPTNGYRCRCTVISLTEAQAKKRGGPTDPMPDPETTRPDPGWDYNPGADYASGPNLAIEKTVEKIKTAIEAAYKEGESKLKGNGRSVPALSAIKNPLRDGDTERPDDEAYANSYFINANSATAPGIVDANCSPILERSEVYSGVYGRASISFYAFNSNGNKGIACGLNNLQKIRDGEPLGGRTRAEDDFATDDDDDFLS